MPYWIMDCKFAIYCDTDKAQPMKIHRESCSYVRSHEAHDHEWFYAPTYQNAKIITGLLEKDRNLGSSDCLVCKPS